MPIVIGAFGTITKGLGSWQTGRDYRNDSIAENSQNPETSPGDLRRLAVTQTPVKNHQLTLMWKTLKEQNNNNNNNNEKEETCCHSNSSERLSNCYILTFDPAPKMLFLGDTPEGSDTFQWPVIERDHVGGLRLMIWDKVKVSLCHYSHAPEESNLWTAWQLFPLDDD